MTSDLRALAERAANSIVPAPDEWDTGEFKSWQEQRVFIRDVIERVARQAVEAEREKLAEKIAELKRRNEILADRKDDYFVALHKIKTIVGNIGDCIEIARKALEIKPITSALDDTTIEHVRKLFLVDYRSMGAELGHFADAEEPPTKT